MARTLIERVTRLENIIDDLGYRIEQLEQNTDTEDRVLTLERSVQDLESLEEDRNV